MVRGKPITAVQRRRLLAKLQAARQAEAAADAYLLELSEAGVSVETMSEATGKHGAATHLPGSTLHRRVTRARMARKERSDRGEGV